MFEVDWTHLFVPNTSLVEIFIRGSVIYLVLFTVCSRRSASTASRSSRT
jgi:hypothetical protein